MSRRPLLKSLTALALAVCALPTHAADKDIVSTAVEAGSFKTLAAALDAAGLVATLQGQGPFTVFAPTDDAFAKLPAGTVENLLKPENKAQLAAILKFHVVPGRLYAADLAGGQPVKTLQGASVSLTIDGSQPQIGNAKVVAANIDAANGVIHVIDQVLLPPKPVSQTLRHGCAPVRPQPRRVVHYRVQNRCDD